MFRDVTKGRNHCGAGRAPQITCCQYGFSATKGFDPVSGLGSVDFLTLKRAILRLHNVHEDGTNDEKVHEDHDNVHEDNEKVHEDLEKVHVDDEKKHEDALSKRIVDFAKIFQDNLKGLIM